MNASTADSVVENSCSRYAPELVLGRKLLEMAGKALIRVLSDCVSISGELG